MRRGLWTAAPLAQIAITLSGLVLLVDARTLLQSASWADAATKLPGEAPRNSDGSCPTFPANNEWHKDVSRLPVHPNSDAILAQIGLTTGFHPDFGGGYGSGVKKVYYGIPFNVVKNQAKVPIKYVWYGSESDKGPFPVPANASVEGAFAGCSATKCDGDRHVIVVDETDCTLYELYYAKKTAAGWSAGSGAKWSMLNNKLRPLGWTSADAAGLPIYPGLVKFTETVTKKLIEHAIRFTGPNSRQAYELPAEHFAPHGDTGPDSPWMGMRVRLRSTFNCSTLASEPARVMCAAMKKYGLIFADNGSPWYVSGEATSRWDPYVDGLVGELRKIKGSDMQVLVNGCVCTDSACSKYDRSPLLATCDKAAAA